MDVDCESDGTVVPWIRLCYMADLTFRVMVLGPPDIGDPFVGTGLFLVG